MDIFNADQQRNVEINNLLQRIKYKTDKQEGTTSVYFPISILKGNKFEFKESTTNQIIFKELKKMGVIEFDERACNEMNETVKENRKLKNKAIIVEGYLIKPIQPKFTQICEEYRRKVNEKSPKNETKIEDVNNNNQIQNIIIVRPKNSDGNYKFLVNEDYRNPKVIRKDSNLFKNLIKIIEDKDPVEFKKEIFDYFNFNKVCPIYFKGKYKLTNILENEGGYLRINPIVKKEIIAEKTFIHRTNNLR